MFIRGFPLFISPSLRLFLSSHSEQPTALYNPPPTRSPAISSWLDEFVPFSLFHLATVAAFGAAMLASCTLGRCWRNSSKEARFRHAWGWAILAFQVYVTIWYFLPSQYELGRSLPLQLCDLAAFVAAFAMLTQKRWLRTLLYFWGIGLSTQAFFTPVLRSGLAHTHYWLFWIGHTAIVGSAIYDVVVRRYRPTLPDLRFVLLVSVVYIAAILALDVALDVNYAYVGKTKPLNPTLIDKLGPWPGRVGILALIVIADYVLLWAVWPISRRLSPKAGGPAAPPPNPAPSASH